MILYNEIVNREQNKSKIGLLGRTMTTHDGKIGQYKAAAKHHRLISPHSFKSEELITNFV
jgi:hypothetical protein